jgi:hypothetical protein
MFMMLYNVVVEEEEEEEEERVAVGTCRHRRDRKKRTSMVRGARAGPSSVLFGNFRGLVVRVAVWANTVTTAKNVTSTTRNKTSPVFHQIRGAERID